MSGEHVQILETDRTVTAGCIPTLPVAVSICPYVQRRAQPWMSLLRSMFTCVCVRGGVWVRVWSEEKQDLSMNFSGRLG